MRYGQSSCDGLDAASFARDVRLEVERLLTAGRADVRTQAKLLLDDAEAYWLTSKPRR
jgi:hypothetical protein